MTLRSPSHLFASGLAVAAFLAAAPLAAAPPKCGRLIVSSPGATATEVPSAVAPKGTVLTFSALAIEDLVFTVRLPGNFDGDHEITLRVYLPEGNLYETLVLPVSAGASGRAAPRRLEGYPFPVVSQVPRRVDGGADHGKVDVAASLPVAGSAIVHSSLYGDWRVDAYLDGEATLCAASLYFRLTE